MPTYPQAAATEEDGPQFDPIMSNHIFPEQLTRLREAGRRMSVMQKLTRETAAFHREAARRHGVNTHRGLLHYKAARAYEAGGQKMMEYFENGAPQNPGAAPLNPKAVMQAHQDAIKFHKKMAEKHGLDSDQGHAHVAMLEHHMNLARAAKGQAQQGQQPQGQPQSKPQQQQPGVKGRQSPVPVPKKSAQPSMDVRQNKPPIQIKPQEAREGGPGSGRHKVKCPDCGKTLSHSSKSGLEEKLGGHLVYDHDYDMNGAASQASRAMRGSKSSKESVRGPLGQTIEAKGTGKNEKYVAQRYDKSHPEGFKKSYEANEGGPGSGPQGGAQADKDEKRFSPHSRADNAIRQPRPWEAEPETKQGRSMGPPASSAGGKFVRGR